MRRSKKELIEEVEREVKQRNIWSTFKSIVLYLRADQSRHQSALHIGIFTVFLLVMTITMFKSVIDSSPILFVKLGQE